ncbi:hypothetical protein XB05_20635 [Xanthomonas arboricola]|uniref:hypothetical protein n=1 Tax=Xanthomonas arboricola TaxID=56448 RepID=UPI00061A1DC6|nr:hypothetical protein [Xanthomonas arboricola]AKC80868.1 hypothetical protein XB05_20635 [Xanthomonas arboricola]
MSGKQFRWAAMMGLVLFPSMGVAVSKDVAPSLDDAYSELVELDDLTATIPGDMRQKRLREAYASDFLPVIRSASLSRASSSDLHFLLRASHRLAYYSNDPRYLDDMMLVMKASQSAASADDLRLFHATLVQFRRFHEAGELAQEHPGIDLEDVPVVQPMASGGKSNAYAIDTEKDLLREIEISTRGQVLVAVVHPLCGFSLRAMHDLRNSPLLRGTTTVWLAPVGQRIYYDVLKEWNAEHPDQEIMLARSTADWSMVEQWATPNFYLLRDGHVISHFSGWPKTGNWQALRDLLAERFRE